MLRSRLRSSWSALRNTRLVVDRNRRLGQRSRSAVEYDVGARKEEVAREHILSRPGDNLRFLDLGARDGKLEYLLGIRENLDFDRGFYEENLRAFRAKYGYWGMDLEP